MLHAIKLFLFVILLIPTLAFSQSPPVADAGPDQSMFLGELITLHGTAADPDGDPIVGWFWSVVTTPLGSAPAFGPADSPNPGFQPDMLGDYQFSMSASDGISGFGLPDLVTVHVVENLPPVAVAAADVTTGTAHLRVNFDGTQSYDPEGGALAHDWNFGDGSLGSAEVSPSYVYKAPGTYLVVLTVIDDWGQPAEDTITIMVTLPASDAPVAAPTASPQSGDAPLTVQFTANATDPDGDPLNYAWDFGAPGSIDNTSSLSDPVHTYQSPGTYTVWFSVSDGANLTNIYFDIWVTDPTANNAPVADAGVDQSMFLGDSTILNGSATDADEDPIVDWAWLIVSQPLGSTPLFGPADNQNPAFQPDMLGDYQFAMAASDGINFGLADFVTVHVVENLPPVAVAAADIVTGPAPLTVSFDGTQSYDPEGGVLTHDWDFGDGSLGSAEVSPSYVYQAPGTYLVVLTVIDDWGQPAEDTLLITVVPVTNNPPIASPSASPNSGSAPLAVQFSANALDPDGDPLSFAWDFGDPASADNSSSLENPAHSYNTAGAHVTWLTVSDGQDEVSDSITVVVDSTLSLSLKSAQVKWKKRDHTRAKVQLKADISPIAPALDDIISVSFDGITLFAEPFSSFVLAGYDDEDDDADEEGVDDDDNPGKFKFKDKNLKVELDVLKGRLQVQRKKIDMHDLDNSNGVDVELHIGSAVAVENVTMIESEKKLRYRRSEGEHD